MSVFGKKGMIRYGFVFLLIAVSISGIAADGQPISGDERAMTVMYAPSQEKSRELIAVELIRPAKYSKLYIGLRQAIQENGWQPIAKSAENGMTDRCAVALLANDSGYVLECAIFHQDHTDVLQAETKSAQEVVATIKAFSGLKHHPSSLFKFKSKNKLWI